jgi:hypothetical protein
MFARYFGILSACCDITSSVRELALDSRRGRQRRDFSKHIMSTITRFAGIAFFFGATSVAFGSQTFVESFSNGSNVGAWHITQMGDMNPSTGGNPGAYIEAVQFGGFEPTARTTSTAPNPFIGDFRARDVTSIGIDLETISAQFGAQRPLTLMLYSDNGTPGNPNDDCEVYVPASNLIPQIGAGWTSIDVPIPEQSAVIPSGWQTVSCAATPDIGWNEVIQNVTTVMWVYGEPGFFYPADVWSMGMDNPRITSELGTAFCSGDGSGTACPCGNAGAAQHGCANSVGAGAFLDANGSASVAANDMTLVASGLPATTSTLFFQGTTQVNGGAGTTFGDGLRCVGGTIVRLGIRTASAGVATIGPGLAAPGGWGAGQNVDFQCWYRNISGPCSSGYNLSNGRSITFAP